jgi:hypothetical protein
MLSLYRLCKVNTLGPLTRRESNRLFFQLDYAPITTIEYPYSPPSVGKRATRSRLQYQLKRSGALGLCLGYLRATPRYTVLRLWT